METRFKTADLIQGFVFGTFNHFDLIKDTATTKLPARVITVPEL